MALVGVSVVATLALLAAEDDRLRDRVSLVSGIAPYTDLAEVIRLATTGYHRDPARPDRLVRYETEPFLDVAVARSVVAALPPGHDRILLLVDEDAPDPLAALRRMPTAGLDDDARSVVDLLANRDPRRFDELYAALPAPVRDQVEGLSPLRRARRLRVPVELASAPADKYFPVAQSQALARAAPDARVTVTTVLSHAIPEPSLRDVDDVLRFDAFVVRSLREASGD